MNTTRVYDFLKGKKRDQKMRKQALKYDCKLPEFENNIDFLSDEWYTAIEKGDIKEKTKKGFISSISGDVSDGKSFPTFQLNANGKISTWERKSDLSFFGMYLKDKYYKTGKKVTITYVKHDNINPDKTTNIVKYIDVET